jgi:hypothetical protein
MRQLTSRLAQLLALVIGLSGLSAGFGHTGAEAAQPAPAWQIHQVSFPTNLMPGSVKTEENQVPFFELFVTNVGGAAADGTTVRDVLPAGLSPSASELPKFRYIPNEHNESGIRPDQELGDCAVSGQNVTCTISKPIESGMSFVVTIPLNVSSLAPPTVTNEVTVEGGGSADSSQLATTVSTASLPFAILGGSGLATSVSDEVGGVPTPGSHPYVATFNIGVTKRQDGGATEALRNVGFELPRGFVVNPRATTARCSAQLMLVGGSANPAEYCPPASQVGQAFFVNEGLFRHGFTPIYNLAPPPGAAAALAFSVENTTVVVRGGLSGDLRLTAASNEILRRFSIAEVALTLWGNPSDHRHDLAREGGRTEEGCVKTGGCSVAPSPAPFLTMPTSCTEPTQVSATVDSWLGSRATATAPLTDRDYNPVQMKGCDELRFAPTILSRATTDRAESPSGLDFGIFQPQNESPAGRATAALKDATVTLPEGMTLNPSAANGLSSCTEDQMGYAPEEGKIRFATTPQKCPDAAKVGTLEVTTPLLEKKLGGSVFVAKPFDNPFGSLLAIYLAIEDEETGIVAKLAGKVEPDPVTGRLTARFTENPELPIEYIHLHLFEGDRATLTTPLGCGDQTTTSTLTPWSTPEGADAHPTDRFGISPGCAGSEGQAPKTVSFTAGTTDPLAGAYSPFVLRISRPDASQHITGIETTLPQGLLGKLAGVAYCPESGIAQAISREHPEQGKLERSSSSCPPSSEVGSVQVTAGSGPTPIPVSGHAYLAGPYKGAPLSLVVIVPAVAGPFDLGNVVDRVALNVGEYDARIHAVADPVPTIREGIALDMRSIELKLDRPSFTLNPTSCEAMAIEGQVSTQAGQSAALRNRFQVGECARLAFRPSLKISLKGATKRTGHPALKAVVTYPKKGAFANIARAQVSLPHSEFLDQGSIGKACTKVLLAQRACPARSIYGTAKAWSPLIDKPLEGPVYLVGGYGYKLPAMVAELDGQIRVLLVGKVDTGKNKGIRNTFEAVPDAPVSRFVLELKGGKKYGLLENSEDICKKKQVAGVSFTAHNGRAKNLSVKIANSCGSKKKGAGKGGGGKK